MSDKLDKRLAQLKVAKERFNKDNHISSPKIQRVPHILRQNTKFADYYTPKIISFGPIHHGSENLKKGEDYKLLWTSKYVAEYSKETHQDANQAAQVLLKKIEDNIEELKNLFTEDAIGFHDDNKLAWMLFVDGCSLLHFMENVDQEHPEALNLKLGQLMYMWRDIILLENQLPTRLLKMLTDQGANLANLLSNYHTLGEFKRLGMIVTSIQNPDPIHILDSCRSIYLSPETFLEADPTIRIVPKEQNVSGSVNVKWYTYKNIRDLKTAGIRVKANDSAKAVAPILSNVSFNSNWFSGELKLPVFAVSDVTPSVFRNFIAYEMCPDVNCNYECCSFFTFMDSLIDAAEDVKELRLAGVFQNLHTSDEEIAKFFNEMGDALPTKMHSHSSSDVVVAYSKQYIDVKNQIEKHYKTKWRTWLAQAYNTHFNTPWAMIAFLAASLALVLTFIQTWFAVHPPKN